MNLTWHIVKKDLRRLRLAFILWALLPIIQAVTTALLISVSFPRLYYEQLVRLCMGVEEISLFLAWLLTILLAVQVVLEDSLRDNSAFWLTRPIAGKRLLAAKASLLALLVFVPLIPKLILLGYFGAHGGELLLAAVEEGLWRAVAVVGVVLFTALIKKSVASFIRVVAVSLVTGFALLFVAELFREVQSPPTLILSAILAAKLLFVGMGCSLLIRQYCVRNARWVGFTAYVATVFALLALAFWPWDFFLAARYPEAKQALALSPAFGLSSLELKPRDYSQVGFQVESLPQSNGDVALPLRVPALTVLNISQPGRSINTEGYSRFTLSMTEKSSANIEPAALERCLTPLKLLNPPKKLGVDMEFFTFDEDPPDSVEKLRLAGSVAGKLMRYVIEAEVPLAEGASARFGHSEFHLEKIVAGASRIKIILRQLRFRSTLLGDNSDDFPRATLDELDDIVPNHGLVYLLVNRARGEARLPLNFPGYALTNKLGELDVEHPELEFGSAGAEAPLDADWLRGATLLRVRFVEIGPLEGTLKATGVTLKN